MMRGFRKILCVLALAGVASLSAYAAGLTVKTEGGLIQGFTKNVLGSSHRSVNVFLGVPYAQPPVGDLRWKKPQRVKHWDGIRDGSVMPRACKQKSGGSEDCLYLNIYRSADLEPGQQLPVIVYAYGGANVSGQASDYDGARMASYNNVLVVTLQHRLGAFGFLNVPGQMDDAAGNFGVADMLAALMWVRRNINDFGGNPDSITLVSQSSGSTNACRLLVDKKARGAFHAAILQSEDCLHDVDTPADSERRSQKFLQNTGCAGETDSVACLRSLSSDDIERASEQIRIWNPVAQGSAVSQIAQGNWNKVPVLLGSNREEGRSAGAAFMGRTEAEYVSWVQSLMGPDAKDALLRYPAYKYSNKFAIPYVVGDLITDSGMRGLGGCTNLNLARSLVKGGAPAVYFYEFQDDAAPSKARLHGYQNLASHGTELAYLWPDSARFQPLSLQFTEEQAELGKAMRRYWAIFARYKNPNTKKLPSWKRFTENGSMMALKPGASGSVPVEEFVNRHNCRFWSSKPPILARGE